MSDAESALRLRIMEALAEHMARTDGTIARGELADFTYAAGERLRLIDGAGAGIWNPASLNATLSIVSSPDGPYQDQDVDGGLLRYDYEAGSTDGRNRKLRRAFELGLPLILLRKIAPSRLLPIFPVYVVADDLDKRQFVIALDEGLLLVSNPTNPTDPERRYAKRVGKQRLHQPEFRARVIRAYQGRCAVCGLNYPELLDASHIINDADSEGVPAVTNGLSLCKLHHSAYDRDLLGISPDLVVHIEAQLLAEHGGPMLKHGFQEMHGCTIAVPRTRSERPDHGRLDVRFQKFLAANANLVAP